MSSRPLVAAAALGLLLLAGVGVFVLQDESPPPAVAEPGEGPTQPERRVRPPKRGQAAPGEEGDDGEWKTIPSSSRPPFPRGGVPAEPSLLSDDGHPRRVSGVVLDDATGSALPGAVVRYLVLRNGSAPVGLEAETDTDGSFAVGLPRRDGRSRKQVRVFVRAPGYEDLLAEADVEPLELRLRERSASLRLGRIVGTVKRDERPFHGRIMVEARDEFGGFAALWTVADRAGRFELVGFRSGRWWVNVHGSERRARAQIGDAGDAVVELQVGESIKAAGDVPLPPQTREVVIASIPPDVEDGAVVRAKVREDFFWRASVRDSRATFAALPMGQWDIAVEDGERTLARGEVLVEPGEGPITVHVRKAE